MRISLTDRCNLRCTYCMPEEGIAWTPVERVLSADEIVRLARLFVKLGVRKIRLTGGEPLLRADLDNIVASLARIDGLQMLAMTTNGIGLPQKAAALRQLGLQSLTISLDTLQRARFAAITKRDRFDDVIAGIHAALSAGFAPLKINIVVMRDVNEDEITDFIAWAGSRPINLRFIEYMPFPDNHWSNASLVPYSEMRARIEQHHTLTPKLAEPSAVGKDFALADSPVTVSFVTSMTESFCGTCNRLRLTADGNIKSCLFNAAESSLRDVIRRGGSDDDLAAIIRQSVYDKQAAHAGLDFLPKEENRAMIAIGG